MDRTFIGILIAAAIAFIGFKEFRQRARGPKQVEASVKGIPAKISTSNGSCPAQNIRLRWPMVGEPGKDWVIANYADLDKGKNSVRDYLGRFGSDAVTYDGHQGVDIEIANFRAMDHGVPVYGAMDGVVEEVYSSSPDRNLHCSPDKWNFVRLRHAGGWKTIYGHLKRDSVRMRPGSTVSAGTLLGYVGSSGCSTYPHLHFEVQDCQGRSIDPVKESLFVDFPGDVMTWSPKVMDLSVFQPEIDSILPIQDPGTTDRNLVSIRHNFSVGISISALKPGDVLSMEFLSPMNESQGVFFERRMSQFLPRSHWWGNYRFDFEGRWILLIKVNGRVLLERPILATR